MSNKISQHVQIKPGRTCIHMRASPAPPPTLEAGHLHFDLRQPPKSSGLIWERDGVGDTGSPSVIVPQRCAKVHQCAGERGTSLWAQHRSSANTPQHLLPLGGPAQEKSRVVSPNVPESSLNSNSKRLLLCVFVSFRSHLAITGANLWSAPGYSVKMTDLSPHLPPNPRLSRPPGHMAFTSPGVPDPTGTRMP